MGPAADDPDGANGARGQTAGAGGSAGSETISAGAGDLAPEGMGPTYPLDSRPDRHLRAGPARGSDQNGPRGRRRLLASSRAGAEGRRGQGARREGADPLLLAGQ